MADAAGRLSAVPVGPGWSWRSGGGLGGAGGCGGCALRRPWTRPGVVEVDEGQVGYLGPTFGGYVALPDLVELRLIAIRGQRLWRLKQADGQALLIPVAAAGGRAAVRCLCRPAGHGHAGRWSAAGGRGRRRAWCGGAAAGRVAAWSATEPAGLSRP